MGYTKIVIGGESAGTFLSIVSTLYLRDSGMPLPVAVLASSPPNRVDNFKNEVYKYEGFEAGGAVEIVKAYCLEADPKDPYVSPIFADFRGFPPLLIQMGGDEYLCAGGVKLAEAAAADDVDVLLHVWKGMGHSFALMFGLFPEADAAMREMADFVQQKLSIVESYEKRDIL